MCSICTMFPHGPPSPALCTVPDDAAKTGVPVDAPKSIPLCGITTCSTGCMRFGLKRDVTRASGSGERNVPRNGCWPFAS